MVYAGVQTLEVLQLHELVVDVVHGDVVLVVVVVPYPAGPAAARGRTAAARPQVPRARMALIIGILHGLLVICVDGGIARPHIHGYEVGWSNNR